jgi:hypothetical protein
LLHRYTGQERLAISYPVAIREGEDFFYGSQVNTNLMPYHFNANTKVIELLKKSKNFLKLTLRDDIKCGYLPITDIIQTSGNKELLNVSFGPNIF